MTDNPEDDDDKTGYGRPPKRTQFRKGKSGNPKGRRKGVKNVKTAFLNALKETVIITEKGKRKSLTIRELLIKQLMNKGISGNLPAIIHALGLASSIEPPDETDAVTPPFTEADREVMEELLKRRQKKDSDNDNNE